MAASVPLIDPQPLSAAESTAALEILRSLAKKRADIVPLSLQELSSVVSLLHTYNNSQQEGASNEGTPLVCDVHM